MRLDKINTGHFILTDDASFINLTRDQVRTIWLNLHMDYPDLFLFLGEQILETQKARKTLQIMVDQIGNVREAMSSIEEDVVRLARELKFKKDGVVRTPAHATFKPAVVEEVPVRRTARATPLLPSLPMEEIPTAPVFRWEPRLARTSTLELEEAVAN